MKEAIEKILSLAVMAPSGDNAQPWRFEAKENKIFIFNIPSKDTSLYNFNQQASFVGHGALIENIKIASSHEGFDAQVALFPRDSELSDQSNLVASIMLLPQKETAYSAELFPYIEKRASNRKKYQQKEIEASVLEAFKTAADQMTGVKFAVVTSKPEIERIAHAVSMNEKIVLETQEMHRFLFKHVTWNAEDDKKRHGFFIKTFEFKPQQEAAFRLLRYWPLMKIANKFGMANVVAKDNESIFKASAAFGGVSIDPGSNESYVKSGMLLQKIWLIAQKNNVALQPTTGIIFLKKFVDTGNQTSLSEKKVKIIKNSYETLENIFQSQHATLSLAFRIGYGDSPSAKTSRHAPDITFI